MNASIHHIDDSRQQDTPGERPEVLFYDDIEEILRRTVYGLSASVRQHFIDQAPLLRRFFRKQVETLLDRCDIADDDSWDGLWIHHALPSDDDPWAISLWMHYAMPSDDADFQEKLTHAYGKLQGKVDSIINRSICQSNIARKATTDSVLMSIYTAANGVAALTARRSTSHGGRASQARSDDDPAPADLSGRLTAAFSTCNQADLVSYAGSAFCVSRRN